MTAGPPGQRLGFWGEEAQLGRDAACFADGGARQRELVQREQPARAGRLDERHPAHAAFLELAQEATVLVGVGGVVVGSARRPNAIRAPGVRRARGPRSDDCDLDPVSGQSAQRQERLKTRH